MLDHPHFKEKGNPMIRSLQQRNLLNLRLSVERGRPTKYLVISLTWNINIILSALRKANVPLRNIRNCVLIDMSNVDPLQKQRDLYRKRWRIWRYSWGQTHWKVKGIKSGEFSWYKHKCVSELVKCFVQMLKRAKKNPIIEYYVLWRNIILAPEKNIEILMVENTV